MEETLKHLSARMIASAKGRLPTDAPSCPDWGPESVGRPAFAHWEKAHQRFRIVDMLDDGDCCRACGRTDLETETIFVSRRMVLAAAREVVAHDTPLSLPATAFAYDCPRCGSDEVRVALFATFDPALDGWIPGERISDASVCGACGHGIEPEIRHLRPEERTEAARELRKAAPAAEKMRKTVLKLAEFLGG